MVEKRVEGKVDSIKLVSNFCQTVDSDFIVTKSRNYRDGLQSARNFDGAGVHRTAKPVTIHLQHQVIIHLQLILTKRMQWSTM
jgi:hypothetical protein